MPSSAFDGRQSFCPMNGKAGIVMQDQSPAIGRLRCAIAGECVAQIFDPAKQTLVCMLGEQAVFRGRKPRAS